MTDVNETHEKPDINTLVDLVYEHYLATQSTGWDYYKQHYMNKASEAVSFYQRAMLIDDIMRVPGIQSVEFEFEHEYNDEGGTYLSITGNINYSITNEDGEELSGGIRAYPYGEGLEIDEDYRSLLTEEQEEALDDIRVIVENTDSREIDNYNFLKTVFTTEKTAHMAFKDEFLQENAVIQKYLLEQGIPSHDNDRKPAKVKVL